MNWTAEYVGIPYTPGGRERSGIDCWGLLRLVYHEQLGVMLPELAGVADDFKQSARLIAEEAGRWERLEKPAELCAVVMGQRSVLHHVGVWTCADGGKVIHAWKDLHVIADTMRILLWKGFRRIEFYGLHH